MSHVLLMQFLALFGLRIRYWIGIIVVVIIVIALLYFVSNRSR